MFEMLVKATQQCTRNRTDSAQRAFTLIETLLAVSLLSVAAMGVAMSAIESQRITKRNLRNSYAAQLALEKMEQLAATDPSTLSSLSNSTETSLTKDNVAFTRQTTIVVNADASRTVTVSVTGNQASLGGQSTFTDTFPLWGNT